MDLTTSYMGLKLKNPIIAGSSGLTGTLDGIVSMDQHGAGAVVLKSIFEEEILLDVKEQMKEAEKNPMIYSGLSETLDYLDVHIREDNLGKFLQLIRDAKNAVSIPIIANEKKPNTNPATAHANRRIFWGSIRGDKYLET